MMFPTLPRRQQLMPPSTYYDKHYRMTSAMIRARQQYLIKNIFAGLALGGFVLSIYAYTIKAVAQDDFSDVPIPDTPPPDAATTAATSAKRLAGGEKSGGIGQAAVARMRE